MTESSTVPSFLKANLLPAVTLEDADSGLRVAEALLKGGLQIMEVTFRTQATASAITAIAKEFPEMHIGAGTILTTDQLMEAKETGAQFGLAPGFNQQITDKALELDFPFIPGVSTPSEIERALASGFKLLKLFPAGCLGGAHYIRKLEGPYLHTGFRLLPMGGINASNVNDYIAQTSVQAAGGSWLAPKELIANKQFKKITMIVRQSLEQVRDKASGS